MIASFDSRWGKIKRKKGGKREKKALHMCRDDSLHVSLIIVATKDVVIPNTVRGPSSFTNSLGIDT